MIIQQPKCLRLKLAHLKTPVISNAAAVVPYAAVSEFGAQFPWWQMLLLS